MQNNNAKWTAEVKSNISRLHYWVCAWVISIGLLAIGPKLLWNLNTSMTIVVGLANLAIGVGMIMANMQFVKGQDEMQQKIFLEAAALTLGITVVFGGSYQLWGSVALISFEPQVWHLLCVMGLAFMIAMSAVTRKYR